MRRRTRLDYLRRLERVLAFIAEHLDEPLDLATLSRVATFSPFHFHRVFRAMTGESLGEVVRAAQLARAGHALRTTNEPIGRIAAGAGYESSAAFARAFRRRTGFSPTAWRRSDIPMPPSASQVSYLPAEAVFRFSPKPTEVTMDVTIEMRPPLRHAALRHVGAYTDVGQAFERLTAWAGRHGLLGPDTEWFSLSWDDPDVVSEPALRSDACITLPAGCEAPLEGDIRIETLEAGRYATTLHVGPYRNLTDTYRAFYGEWLPSSGERPADRGNVEVYIDNPMQVPEAELRTLVCMPLEPEVA